MTNTSTTTKVTLHKENKKKVLDFIKLYLEQRYIQYFVTEEIILLKLDGIRQLIYHLDIT